MIINILKIQAMVDPTRLLVGYDRRVSPYYVSRRPVSVNLSIPYLQLTNLIEDEQSASWLYAISMKWQDPRLIYNPIDYENDTIYLPAQLLWTPRFSVYNSMETRRLFEGFENDVEIEPNGVITLRIIQFTKAVCEVQVERLPFDTQYCGLEITYPLQVDKYYALHGIIDRRADCRGNSEYEMINVTIQNKFYALENFPGDIIFKEVTFTAQLKRKTFYFIVVIIIPSVLVSSFTVTGILLPAAHEAGSDLFQVGMSAMLSLSITLSVVADTIPRTAKVPLIACFVLCCLGTVAAAVALGLALIQLKKRSIKRGCLPAIFYVMAFSLPPTKKSEKDNGTKESLSMRKVISRLYMISFTLLQLILIASLVVFFSYSWKTQVRGKRLFTSDIMAEVGNSNVGNLAS
ncbi:unnamed protein product, partial [Mesorhabditis belari]|uniref:Neurotransmitter-gated ion-channel ligand-binding domain-containing protein n=1 Tax=Mesorhabditis belari TaxID=2138241 RepID=A0AAF3FQQ7_9BILA